VTNKPKVFVSHAGEDNIFVENLGKCLIEKGVDPWIDFWELLPGDKLIDKIFNKGIGKCDVFIIVLSQNSIKKPWVIEELDTALVKRIESQTKLIPIRIDDCEIPMPLKATVWKNVDPQKELLPQIEPIVTSIYDLKIKPKSADIPEQYQDLKKVDEYNVVETSVLKALITIYYETGEIFIWGHQIQDQVGFTPDEINDAVEILEGDGLIKIQLFTGTGHFNFGTVRITSIGFVNYADHFLGIDTNKEMNILLSEIVSQGNYITSKKLGEQVKLSPYSINKYVGYLELQGYIKVTRYSGTSPFDFGEVIATAQGRRIMR